MASEATFKGMDMANPCCLRLKASYTKMEGKRNALRQGLKILQDQVDRLQQENINLKKAYGEERRRASAIEEEKGKEASLRISMEKEIASLKLEISSARCEAASGNADLSEEVTLLRTSLNERQVQIDNFNQLLTEERRKAHAEKERADLEKKRAGEVQVALEHEKIRADEAKNMVDSMEKEMADLKSQILSSGPEVISGMENLNKEVTHLQACVSEREREIERLKQVLTEEETKADAERQRAESERTKAVELQVALAYEKRRADEASKVAGSEKKITAELQVALEHEKIRADEARKMVASMEKEIADLKSEISSSGPEVISGMENLNKEVTHLQACVSERECEIERLKQVLTEEERKGDAERQRTELERIKAVELQEALAYEKSRADEASKVAGSQKKITAELQVALENEKNRADEARKMVDSMEKEIAALKSDMSSSSPDIISQMEDLNSKVKHLQESVFEREQEIERLKKVLTEEDGKADAERQCADLERRKNVEFQEALAYEKSRADEASKMADAMGKKVEENSVQLEALKNELAKTKLKYEDVKKKLESEKQRVIKEKKNADEEKARVIEQRKIAEANEKQVVEEKSRAHNLLMQLEDKQRDVEKLQKELQDFMSSQKSADCTELDKVKRNLEAEKKKYAREKKRADDEMSKREELKKVAEASTKKSIDEKHRADNLFQELQSSRQRIEHLELQVQKVNKMLEAERQRASGEEKRADAEKLKSGEQKRIAEDNIRIAGEEKSRVNNLLQELESNRKKLQDMENELQQLKLLGKEAEVSNIPPPVTEQTSELQFLRKQLKFEKQRLKHAKEVTELEKVRNNILREEIFGLRKGLECLLHRCDVVADVGTRNGADNPSKKSGLSDAHTRLVGRRMLPSQAYLCGDAEFRMSSLSSRDASCHLKENEGYVPAFHHMESPSASFSDEQLLGSQERVACSLTTSTALAQENTNIQATTLKCVDVPHKHKDGEKVGIGAESSVRSPVKANTGHAVKKRRILDELECIKSMQSEGKRIFEETQQKVSALHSRLSQPTVEQIGKENSQLPACVIVPASNFDHSSKKRKACDEPQAICGDVNDCGQEGEGEQHAVALTVSTRPEHSQVLQDASTNVLQLSEEISGFEALIDGDYMKLLNLDDADDEECFRTAMERPLSPILPEISLRDGEATYRVEAQDQHDRLMNDQDNLYCIVFSDMEENSSISRIFCAVRACVAQCGLFLHRNWNIVDLLAALRLEKDLQPREKVCALFSLILLNLSGASSRNRKELQSKDLLNSFSAHISSVLCSVETRNLFAEICPINDLLSLFEDFVRCRKILLPCNTTSGSMHDSSSSFEISHDGEIVVVSPSPVSTDMVMAGSTLLATICAATGNLDHLREVSFNILHMCMTEDQMALRILHTFALVCGLEYFSSSKYCRMEVVKSVVTYVEHTLPNIAGVDVQAGNSCFVQCVSCPFSDGALLLDDVSVMLMEKLQDYCLGPSAPQVLGEQVHLSTGKCLIWSLDDILSSLELIASIMGWNWAHEKIVPKLLTISDSCDQWRVSSKALVILLGELGRLGVKECGYNDVGVESIKCRLSTIVCHGSSPNCSSFGMAVAYALAGFHPNK